MTDQPIAPREHCGNLMPGWATQSRSECVLRPGHSGSHADDRGARWWYDAGDGDRGKRVLADEVTRLSAIVGTVRHLHRPVGVVAAAEHGEPPDCAACRRSWPCQTYNALDRDSHDDGPSVAECAEADARWPLEKHGE